MIKKKLASMDGHTCKHAAKRASFLMHLKRDRHLCLMFLPILLYYIIFIYLPLPGLYIAFSKYLSGRGIFTAEFVGLYWIRRFFSSIYAWRVIRNTFLISLYSMVFGFPIPIIFALCVNEIRKSAVKRFVQTVSYLPHFISVVVVVGMMKNILAYNDGIVNNLLVSLGMEKFDFFGNPGVFRIMYVGSGVWQSFGFSSIIYLSAIAGINPELYESAQMDGITKFKEVWHITLPMLKQTILTLFLLNIGGLMSVGFEKIYLMYSSAVLETADVISTMVYRAGILNAEPSYATAVGLLNSLVTFILVWISNYACRKAAQMSLW